MNCSFFKFIFKRFYVYVLHGLGLFVNSSLNNLFRPPVHPMSPMIFPPMFTRSPRRRGAAGIKGLGHFYQFFSQLISLLRYKEKITLNLNKSFQRLWLWEMKIGINYSYSFTSFKSKLKIFFKKSSVDLVLKHITLSVMNPIWNVKLIFIFDFQVLRVQFRFEDWFANSLRSIRNSTPTTTQS